MSELSGVPISTCHNIFHTFIKSFTVNFFDQYVSMPTGDKMKEVMNVYKLLDFNECVGSMDCTHIYWNKCPKELLNFCGKRSKTNWSFQCVVHHERKVALLSVEQRMKNKFLRLLQKLYKLLMLNWRTLYLRYMMLMVNQLLIKRFQEMIPKIFVLINNELTNKSKEACPKC